MPLPRFMAPTLLLLWAMAAVGCASTAAHRPVPHPFPMPAEHGEDDPVESRMDAPGEAAPAAARPTTSSVRALLTTALALRGTPYRMGGSDTEGFDCSGFTQFVFAQHGIRLPREVRDQFTVGRTIEPGKLAPGDLVFFSTTSSGPSHVAIALGGDDFVHAPSSRGVVRIEHLSAQYWAPRLVGVRRLPVR